MPLRSNPNPKESTMQLNPYLFFNGQCEAAFRFYEKCLVGKIVAMMVNDGATGCDQMSAAQRQEWQGKIMHARLVLGDTVLMGSDAPPGCVEAAKGFAVTLNVSDPAAAERVFHALAEGGAVQMPIAQTFFAARFGMLADRFGIPWMVVCEQAAASAAA
jgi:PhnB protein